MNYNACIERDLYNLNEWEKDLDNLTHNPTYQSTQLKYWLTKYTIKGSNNRIKRIIKECIEYETEITKTLNKSRSESKREIYILSLQINHTQQQYYQQLLKLINN